MEDAGIRNIDIKPSGISGLGSFVKEKIAKGEYITTLTGKPTRDYKSLCQIEGISDTDPLQIDDYVFLILDHPSRVINHSCDPNAALRNTSDLYAIRDILPGEEITYDYSTTVGINDDMTMTCCCGANGCRKQIGNVLTLPPQTIEKYFSIDALQSFIKKQLLKMGMLTTS